MIQQLSSVSNVLPVCDFESCSNEDRENTQRKREVNIIYYVNRFGQ